jgi:hypothetical protein
MVLEKVLMPSAGKWQMRNLGEKIKFLPHVVIAGSDLK